MKKVKSYTYTLLDLEAIISKYGIRAVLHVTQSYNSPDYQRRKRRIGKRGGCSYRMESWTGRAFKKSCFMESWSITLVKDRINLKDTLGLMMRYDADSLRRVDRVTVNGRVIKPASMKGKKK